MRRSNAEELKMQLLTDVHQSMALKAPELGLHPKTVLFGEPTLAQARTPEAAALLPQNLGTFAVGIGQNGKEHTVEVRTQSSGRVRGFIQTMFTKILSRAAKQEVNVEHIGAVKIPEMLEKGAEPWYQGLVRPLKCGASVGHYSITCGTTGAFVKTADGGTYLLSNNHVLAAVDMGKSGDAILQPGPHDGGLKDEHTIGILDKAVKINPESKNLVDCAIAYINPGMEYYPGAYEGIGKLKGIVSADEMTKTVHKMGRTTGLTHGTVLTTDMDNVMVNMGRFTARFDAQVEITGRDGDLFCTGGDSGSLIIDDENRAAALLFAGSDFANRTFGNQIENVLDALRVEFEL